MTGSLGGEDVRPLARQDFQEFVNGLPMRGEVLGDEICEAREGGALGRDSVEKPGEARGECGGLAGQ